MSLDEDRVLFPPRPRTVDWAVGGASAGLLLGTAELLGLGLAQTELPPAVALAVLGVPALLCALLSGSLGWVLRLRGARPSHSAMAGAQVGPLLLAPLAGPLAQWIGTPGSRLSGLAAALVVLLALGAITRIASRTADRLERSGRPIWGPGLWAGLAGLVAAAGLAAAPSRGAGPALAVIALGVAVAALATATALLRRRNRRPGPSRVRVLAALGALGLAVALRGALLPWLFFERDVLPLAPGPPNGVLALVGPSDAEAGEAENLSLLAGGGVVYSRVPDADGGPGLARLPDGRPLLAALGERGFATHAVVADFEAAPVFGAAELDARPGARGLLAREARFTVAGPLLGALPSGLLAAAGLGGERRDAGRLTADALAWLLDWRVRRSAVPFWLVLDYRNAASLAEADAGIGELLEALFKLEVSERTLVVVAVVSERDPQRLRVGVRPPTRPGAVPARRQVESAVPAERLAEALFGIALSEAEAPWETLPGLAPTVAAPGGRRSPR